MIHLRKGRLGSLLASLACLTLSSLSVAQQNPSFEEGTGFSATNWTQFNNTFREQLVPRTGEYSLKMFGQFSGGTSVSGAFQDFAVAPGQSASASVYGMTASFDALQGDNFAILKLIYRDSANNDLVAVESQRITANTPADIYQQLTAALGPAPVGTDHGSIFLLIVQPDTTPFAGGSAFFDDVALTVSGGTQTVAPSLLTVSLGKTSSGDVTSLAADDGNALVVCKFFVPNQQSPFVQMLLDGTTTITAPSSIKFVLKSKMVTAGSFLQQMEMNNFATNSFELVRSDTLGLAYQQLEAVPANLAPQYVGAGGEVRTRIKLRQTGPSTSLLPCGSFELGQWVVAP